MHMEPWALMSQKKKEFCWVCLLDPEQSRGWKWHPALSKPKLCRADGECLCWSSCTGLVGQGCSCIHWLLLSPCVGSRPCSGSWENCLQNFWSFWFSLGLQPLPEPWLGGSKDWSTLCLWIYSSVGENRDLLLILKTNKQKKNYETISGVEKSVLSAEIGLGQFGSWHSCPSSHVAPAPAPTL